VTSRAIETLRKSLGERKNNIPKLNITIYLFFRTSPSVLFFSLLDQTKHCIARRFLPTTTLGDFTAQMQIEFT